MKWFREKRIELLDWPGNSPDLNRIEDLWQIIKKKFNGNTLSSLDQLKEEIKRIYVLNLKRSLRESEQQPATMNRCNSEESMLFEQILRLLTAEYIEHTFVNHADIFHHFIIGSAEKLFVGLCFFV